MRLNRWLTPFILLFLSACVSTVGVVQPSPDVELTRVFEKALQAAAATLSPTITPSPTPVPITPTPENTPLPTLPPGPPPDLPAVFTTSISMPGIIPQTYIQDICLYLKNRWDPQKSAPGTVVMPVMFHSVTEDYNALSPDNSQVHHSDMVNLFNHAHELGFKTITVSQLVDFLEQNAKIPKRSLLLIIDDRRPGVVREHFLPFLEKYNWTVALGWLIGDTDSKAASPINGYPQDQFKTLWDQMEFYNATGRLDVQSHGYIHNTNITKDSSDEFIRHEMVDSRKVLQDHFYCKDPATKQPVPGCKTDQPLAYIWPGGSFTKRGTEIGREAGYKVGFTVNPRGPVMFNWVPLAETADPRFPSYIPEIPVQDPLMTLPRYWSIDAAFRLDEVATIGEQAAAYAKQNRDIELEYYAKVCQQKTGELPQAVP